MYFLSIVIIRILNYSSPFNSTKLTILRGGREIGKHSPLKFLLNFMRELLKYSLHKSKLVK